MARQTARKGTRRGRLRNRTASKRCKEFEFGNLAARHYWMSRSDGLISVALDARRPLPCFQTIEEEYLCVS
jgi:hypothetical protein